MVNANTLNRGSNRRIVFIVVFTIIALIVISFFAFRFFVSEDGSTNLVSNGVSIPADVLSQIENIGFNVSQPEKVPEGYSRVYTNIISATASATQCEEVVQLYSGSQPDISSDKNPDDLPGLLDGSRAFTEIDIYTYSLECGFARPDDSETFNVGDYPGWISDSDQKTSTLIEIAVNQALVRIETSLDRADITKVLGQFVAFSEEPPLDSVVISNS